MDLLPEDVVADVLRRLPPRGLAVSRSVCREWLSIVDERCAHLLRTDLLPTKLGGIFVMTSEPEGPEFFVRPSMERRVDGRLEHYEGLMVGRCSLPSILDCCNGLLLLDDPDQVVNPATRQWARLPPYRPTYRWCFKYLAFDPAASSSSPHNRPHYEVLAMQNPFDIIKMELELSSLSPGSSEEWPPSVYMMGIYSSTTNCWEERPFASEQGSATTITYAGPGHWQWHATYLNTALYTYWGGDFIMRISLSNDKYKIIHLPAGTNQHDKVCLGKSKNRIHFALLDEQLRLQVWFLDESDGKTEWIFKHGANLQTLYFPKYDHETDTPWISQDGRYYPKNNKEPEVDDDLDWNSDEDNALDIDDHMGGRFFSPFIEVLGFHPYKEILLFWSHKRVVAYYFNNASKIQDLGEIYLRYHHEISEAFMYTPCWIGELFVQN